MMVFLAVAVWFDIRGRGRVHPALLVVGLVYSMLQILLGPIAGSPR
ncbi:hypothetical protein ABI_34500 [Asticcacaulis biprosthecium C19]|uniref:Uncharacterized protein n=1 Tax=Asticcacaulis biprosthecium C19 TaxID=715226 RepID=F4QQE2_9CAUL|nr:hypothetical protein ABI_34500 [Asticcacaulis biprosthecium C19]